MGYMTFTCDDHPHFPISFLFFCVCVFVLGGGGGRGLYHLGKQLWPCLCHLKGSVEHTGCKGEGQVNLNPTKDRLTFEALRGDVKRLRVFLILCFTDPTWGRDLLRAA